MRGVSSGVSEGIGEADATPRAGSRRRAKGRRPRRVR